MPPEPGWLGQLIDEPAQRRAAARKRLSARLRSFGYWLEFIENRGFESKYTAKVARDIRRRIKKWKKQRNRK